MIHRRGFLKAAAAAAGATIMTKLSSTTAGIPTKRPNLLFIIADDQRPDTIRALGNPVISTPNLDRLAATGFAFRQCRTMGSATTGAVCIPARAMIHTGRYLFRVPETIGDYPILPELLRQNGYHTFICGKWHNGAASCARGFEAGAHIFLGGMNRDQYKLVYHDFDPTGRYPNDHQKAAIAFSTNFYTDAAVDFLQSYKDDRPFLCYVAFTSPHDPRTPPAPFDTMYDPAKIPLPPNWLPLHPFDNGDMDVRDEKLAPKPRTHDDTKKQLADYYGMISHQDAAVGRMLDALAASAQLDNTIIVYTSDHGLAIGSHGLFGKQNVYEHSSGVPLLIHGRGIPQGQSDALCYGSDIFPTLCDLLNIPAPNSIDGKSLLPILNNPATRVRDSAYQAYFHGPHRQQAIRDDRWKMIRYDVNAVRTTQLFDLQSDPAEAHDSSRDALAAQQLSRLEALLSRWQSDAGMNAG